MLVHLSGRNRKDPDNLEVLGKIISISMIIYAPAFMTFGIYPFYIGSIGVYQDVITALQSLPLSPIQFPRIFTTIWVLTHFAILIVSDYTGIFSVVAFMVVYTTSQASSVEHLRRLW